MVTVIFAILLTFSFMASQPQEPEPQATLIRRCESNCTGFHRMSEDTLPLRVLKPPAESAALRLCSKQPMTLALISATMRPHVYADFIESTHGIPRSRILFLLSEDCLSPNAGVMATELWSVPAGAPLPPHIEAIESCRYQFDFLGTRPRGTREFEGAVDYKKALNKLARELRANPRAIGVVWGYILWRPTEAMKRRIAEAERVMARSGLPRDRYQVKLEYWYDTEEKPKPNYPSVFLVKVSDTCMHARASTTAQSNNGMHPTRIRMPVIVNLAVTALCAGG